MPFCRILRVVLVLLIIGLVGCAEPSNDGPWASGEPDEASPSPEPQPDPKPEPEPPLFSVNFAMHPDIYSLAHGPAQTWLGCATNSVVKGGYDSNTECGNSSLHPWFGEHLNQFFMNCVDGAATAAGLPIPEKVFLRHWGTYNNRNARNSTRLSLHAYARAIDIQKFILHDSTGAVTQISTHINDYSGATAKFYDAFRQCWRETMPSSCTSDRSEYKGSIGHTKSAMGGNSLHYNHIHLSLPLCAGGS